MPASSAYLFLELAILAYIVGFCRPYWSPKDLRRNTFWRPALFLGCFWLVIDQVAIRIGLWTFPMGGTLPARVLSLPIEEYAVFLLHTLLCRVLLNQYGRVAR